MSWRDLTIRTVRVAACGVLVLASGGCFRPLYGAGPNGSSVRDALASIEVEKAASPIGQERLGYYVRSELAFDLDGSGEPSAKRYKLRLDTAESIQPTSIDTISGRADTATLNGTVKYSLVSRDGTTVVTSGTARATATYNRDQQRFASVRAARDADIRIARVIADDIKQRLAAHFASAP
jgi:LPS-assembly lipoprotein